MIYEIKNSTVSAKIDTEGAQMKSFCLNNGTELLWVGNPEFWKSQAPVLFPIVGALRENKALIGGEWYSIPKHGLAKINTFSLANQSDDEVELEFVATEETMKAYPFNFSFKVKISLGENSFKTTYTIKNNGETDMPYCVGGHPGFNVPFEDGFKFDDYEIAFAQKENITSPYIITETSMYDYTRSKMDLGEVDSFPLNNEVFANDVVVFENLKTNQMAIKNPKTGKSIEMKFADFPMIGMWKPYNDAPFVCLEPWVGCSTTTQEDDEFTSKKFCKALKAGEQDSLSFTVEYKA